MARIPEAELERLKAQVAVAADRGGRHRAEGAWARTYAAAARSTRTGVTGRDAGEEPVALLSCRAGGGPIDWVMKRNGVSFRHAVELLREGTIDLPGGCNR